MKKVLKIIGIVILSIVVLVVGLLVFVSTRPAAPNHYTKTVKTGGETEAKYLAMGSSEVKYIQESADEPIKNMKSIILPSLRQAAKHTLRSFL